MMCKSRTASCYAQVFVAFLALSHCMGLIDGQQCGGTLSGANGTIKSPNYPDHYPSRSNCMWYITVPPGFIVQLTFQHFVVERNFGCSHDYVKIFDGGSNKAVMIGKYCGGMRPFVILATSNKLTFKFVSDQSVSFRGFRVQYTAVKSSPTTSLTPRLSPTSIVLRRTTTILTTTQAPTTILTTTIPTTLKQVISTTQLLTVAQRSTLSPISIFFVRPFRNATVMTGGKHKFVCQVNGTRNVVPMFWSKDSVKLENKEGHIKIYKKHRRKAILEMEKLAKNDSGIYGCHAKDSYGRAISMYGRLVVNEPNSPTTPRPSPVFITMATLNVTADIGEKVVLKCSANGTNPSIRWLVDREFEKGIQRRHKGVYTSVYKMVVFQSYTVVKCIADNPYGHDVKTGVVRTRIVPEPTPTPEAKPAVITMATLNITAGIGENVVLRCTANGTPPILIRWLIDNKYYRGTQRRNGDTYTSFYKMVVVKDYTKVKCEAQNPYGIDTKSGIIQPQPAVAAIKAGPWDSFKPGTNMFYVVLAGGVAVLVLLLLGFVCFRKKVANTRYKTPGPVSLEQLTKNPIFERNSNMYVNPRIEKWDVPRNNIEFMKDLEDGTFSRLFLGRMTHASRGEQDALVHVKVLKESQQTEANKEAFEEEAVDLTTYDHPNVQSLVGVCVTGRPLCLVFECLDRSDLNQFLRDSGCSHYIIRERPNSAADPDTKLSKLDQLCIAKQIASGMQYLYDRGYQHRQLNTKNCMISKSMVVKVANIGISDSRPSTSYNQLGALEKDRYPVRWLPLESVASGVFGDATDLWSFGIVLWEIYSYGMTPYYGMNNDEVIALVREGDILPRPKECPREMYDLMQDCWNLVPRERPTFRFLHEKISALLTGVAV